jgi:hypothetical protein
MLINNHLPESELVSKILVQRKKIRVGVIKFVPTSQHLNLYFCYSKWGNLSVYTDVAFEPCGLMGRVSSLPDLYF